jgi:phospholipase/lecithinase/hemolysin
MATITGLPPYSVLYAFGDSLSDAGNLSIATSLIDVTPVSPPYYSENYGLLSGNVFSNGPTWVQDLSVTLGLGTLAPSLVNGNDFAFGGAETGLTPQNSSDPEIQAISLPSQLAQFEAGVSNPSPDALFTLSIGSNDLLDILADPALSTAQQTTDVNDAVVNELMFIGSLIGDGAKNLLVLDVPDLGKTPDVMDGLANGSDSPSATFDSLASSLASQYNADLASALATVQGANIAEVNAYQLIDDVVADPAAYGLTNVNTPVWSGSYSVSGSGTLATSVPAQQDQYLFWDHLHPTETGEAAVASLAAAALALANATTITATTPVEVVPLGGGDSFVFATVPINIEQSAGASTIISSAGALTVAATGGSDVIFDSGGGSSINEAPSSEYVGNPANAASTITASAGGSDTIFSGGAVLYQGSAGANSLFVGGTGMATVESAASETVFAGSGGGLYQPGGTSFFLFGGGGADTISGGAASPTVWGNSNETLVADSTAGNGVYVAFGNNDSLDASLAGGGNTFYVVNEALTLPSGTFAGNTTLVGAAAGNDTLAVFSEGAAPPAHTITVENWQISDTLYLGNYAAADLAAANAALAAAAAGAGASFTLSDQTTITFVATHPTAVA